MLDFYANHLMFQVIITDKLVQDIDGLMETLQLFLHLIFQFKFQHYNYLGLCYQEIGQH